MGFDVLVLKDNYKRYNTAVINSITTIIVHRLLTTRNKRFLLYVADTNSKGERCHSSPRRLLGIF